MRRVAAMALAALMGIGVAGCSTNGQPNSLDVLNDQAEVLETLRVLGLIALSVEGARRGHTTISTPSYSTPIYVPDSNNAHEDAFTQTGNRRPRSNLTNIDNPFNDTKARTRSGGFRNSWRMHNGDCSPQPTCTLRAR